MKKINVEAKDIKRLLLRVYCDFRNNEISSNQAQKETFILNSLLSAIKISDIEERISNIERTLND